MTVVERALPTFRCRMMVTNSRPERTTNSAAGPTEPRPRPTSISLCNVPRSTFAMPRPVDTPPSPSDSFLCERIQQFHQRMRSRCLEAHRASAASDAPAIPCLLQSWRKRIEAMDNEDSNTHRGHRVCWKASALASSTEESDQNSPSSSASDSASLPCRFPFRGPRMHPRLERQQAVCSLSGIWSGFASSSPPPSPEIYAKPRQRRHPYARCRQDDHRESSTQ